LPQDDYVRVLYEGQPVKYEVMETKERGTAAIRVRIDRRDSKL
jgi:cold shock CspA family protein